MFKFKKELSLKEAEHIARDSLHNILDGYIVCMRRKSWADNLFVIYINSFFYVESKPVLVIADTCDYNIPSKCFYMYTDDEEDASDWELVKINADEYQGIKVDFESYETGITRYNITNEVNRLSNLIGMTYPTYTGMPYFVDSNLNNEQSTKNNTLNKSMGTSYGITRQSDGYYIRTIYSD